MLLTCSAFEQNVLIHRRHCSGVALGIAFAYGWKLTLLIMAFIPFIVVGGFIEIQVMVGGESAERKAYDEAGSFTSDPLLDFFADETVEGISNLNPLVFFTTGIFLFSAPRSVGAYEIFRTRDTNFPAKCYGRFSTCHQTW